MTVHYEALEQPLWYGRWWGPYASYVESAGLWNRQSSTQLGSGDGVTDASGRVAFTLATKPVTADTNVTVTASARDASGRTVTLSRDVLITAASFRIWAAPDDWFGTPGQRTTLRVHVSGYDGDKPVAGVSTRVLVRRTHWDGGKEVDSVDPATRRKLPVRDQRARRRRTNGNVADVFLGNGRFVDGPHRATDAGAGQNGRWCR